MLLVPRVMLLLKMSFTCSMEWVSKRVLIWNRLLRLDDGSLKSLVVRLVHVQVQHLWWLKHVKSNNNNNNNRLSCKVTLDITHNKNSLSLKREIVSIYHAGFRVTSDPRLFYLPLPATPTMWLFNPLNDQNQGTFNDPCSQFQARSWLFIKNVERSCYVPAKSTRSVEKVENVKRIDDRLGILTCL